MRKFMAFQFVYTPLYTNYQAISGPGLWQVTELTEKFKIGRIQSRRSNGNYSEQLNSLFSHSIQTSR